MTRRHPNLYGDTSAFNVPIRGRHVRKCLADPLQSRLLHGSDFPVPIFGHWAWLRRFMGWKDFRRCESIRNVLEKDYQIKRAMGFSEEHFMRISRLLRLPSPFKVKKTGPLGQGMAGGPGNFELIQT
jgi:hypothetical protein